MSHQSVLSLMMVHDIKPKPNKVGFFGKLDDSISEKLFKIGNLVIKKKGDYLSVQGQPHTNMTLIINGQVSVKISANGESLKVAKHGPGDVVGEMGIIDTKKASATVRVISQDAEIWQITGSEFNNFLNNDQVAGFYIMKELAKGLCKRLRTYNERMLHSMFDDRSQYLDQDY